MYYNWQQESWPTFEYNLSDFEAMALSFREFEGQSVGILGGLTEGQKEESLITLLVKEAIKTSVIEGEIISRVDVISSIKKNWGYATPSFTIKDKRSEGIAELLVKSRTEFAADLTVGMLFDWHKLLMKSNLKINIGQWRSHSEPMQVVSGNVGQEKIHFEATPSGVVHGEMMQFINWFNDSKPTGKAAISNPVVRSAIAHLYFESIHPFEDGNGRIGRVIAEKALSQGLNRPILLSLSSTIEADKKSYYQALQKGQKSNQINDWIGYFGNIILKSQLTFTQSVAYSIKKARFFDTHKTQLNERQLKVVGRMLEENENEFIGGMNATKYQAIAKTSKATATRDLQDLVQKQILVSKDGGRSTNYQIKSMA